MMIARNVHSYYLQETLQLGSYSTTIRDHTIFQHGMVSRTHAQGRNSTWMMIILGPDLTQAWARAGKLKPLQPRLTLKYPGWLIGVALSFPNRWNGQSDTYLKRTQAGQH